MSRHCGHSASTNLRRGKTYSARIVVECRLQVWDDDLSLSAPIRHGRETQIAIGILLLFAQQLSAPVQSRLACESGDGIDSRLVCLLCPSSREAFLNSPIRYLSWETPHRLCPLSQFRRWIIGSRVAGFIRDRLVRRRRLRVARA